MRRRSDSSEGPSLSISSKKVVTSASRNNDLSPTQRSNVESFYLTVERETAFITLDKVTNINKQLCHRQSEKF